jgi:GNAT superfamily N-acetyltransferase
MTTYQRESFEEAYQDAAPLLVKHWAEISNNLDIALDVNIDAYIHGETNGLLRIYTARENGVMLGYLAMFVHKGLHYQQSVQATQDVFYVDPDHRGKMLGVRLLNFMEDQLRKEGVQVIHQHVKIKHPALGQLLERRGYTAVETIYQRRLD